MKQLRMCDLAAGKSGVVAAISEDAPLYRRLLDLGLAEGSRVTCLGRSLWGDPAAYRICGAVVGLRREDSAFVLLEVDDD